MKTDLEEVKDLIYEHISLEHEMGLPPHESWESIVEGEEWVDELLSEGYTLDELRGDIFDEVMVKWWKDHPEVDGEDDEEDPE